MSENRRKVLNQNSYKHNIHSFREMRGTHKDKIMYHSSNINKCVYIVKYMWYQKRARTKVSFGVGVHFLNIFILYIGDFIAVQRNPLPQPSTTNTQPHLSIGLTNKHISSLYIQCWNEYKSRCNINHGRFWWDRGKEYGHCWTSGESSSLTIKNRPNYKWKFRNKEKLREINDWAYNLELDFGPGSFWKQRVGPWTWTLETITAENAYKKLLR